MSTRKPQDPNAGELAALVYENRLIETSIIIHGSRTKGNLGIVRDGGKERVDSVGAFREWSGERTKADKGRQRQRQSCKLRNYGGETTGINTKRKQDHKRNHVLERVGRNVMWRAWRL